MDDVGEDFGPWLSRQLRRTGMNQAELAEAVGLTRAAVSAWITGRATPREETMRTIAAVFGLDLGTVHTRTVDADSGRPVKWYHRPAYSDGGRDFGNAATFAFEADVEVLAREATQNSLDERVDETKPVRVRYTLHELSGEHLSRFREAIRWDDLFPHYEAAAAQEQKVGRVIAEGLREMYERDRLVLLRVDDYNASGLTGDDYEDGRFAAVIRRQLDSHKSDASAGGSYGLGKATLWASSRLGMVLVNSTLSVAHEGRTERRVIGRLELPWRVVDGEAWAGPAWFGEADTAPGSEDIARSWWADAAAVEKLHLTRESSDPGTSFLIVGAHDVASLASDIPAGEGESDEDTVQSMHERLVAALGRNFWAAMTGGRGGASLLEASVRTLRNGQVIVPEERVEPQRDQPSRTRALKAYLDGETVERMTETGQVALVRVPLKVPPRRGDTGVTLHEAVLLVTSAEDRDGKPNQLVTMRGRRMAIRTYKVPDLPLGTNPFQAVLLTGNASGDDSDPAGLAETFLRASEPPEHNKWGQTEELRALYSPTAHRRISEFTRAVNMAVRELVGRSGGRDRGGSKALSDLLGLGEEAAAPTVAARNAKVPTIRGLDAELNSAGAWLIRAEVRLPATSDPWLMAPVAKFDVQSGGRPPVRWAEIVPGQNCELVDGKLRFKPGARSASFSATTDVATHPVRSELAGLIVELQRTKEVSA